MNIANGPNRPLPAILSPPLTKCFQITLPDDTEWQGAFFDALFQLTYWFAWERDNAHSGRIVAETWLNVLATLKACQPEPPGDGCCDPGDTQLIRQNPDNPCLIESSADGTHWCTLVDLTLCTPSTGQPGGGATQPQPGGGVACYQGAMRASEVWLLPTVVNAGDTIAFSDIVGAGTDGTLHWHCPDGQIYFAGACVGSLSFDGGDPAPLIHHMALIANIGSVYYDITAGPISVPSGISNAQVTVQVNDGSLAGNSGDYTFQACVTNNQATRFTHHFDFRLSQLPFSLNPGNPNTDAAWIAGIGIRANATAPIVSGRGAIRLKATSPRTLTNVTMRMVGNTTIATNGEELDDYGNPFVNWSTFEETYFQVVIGAFDYSHLFTHPIVNFGGFVDAGGTVGSQCTWTDFYITADGADPF